MLDTRTPSTSARTRRSYSSARPERLPARNPSNRRSQAQAAPAREQAQGGAERRPLPSSRSNRLSRSEMRLMGIATICTAVVCALLLLYLAAYAQVTQLGIAQAQARTELHRNQMRRQLLEAERNSLESPQRIEAAAAAEGMAPRGRTPIDYVSVRQADNSPQEIGPQEISPQENGAQENAQGNSTGGTTKDSRTAAPLSH